MRIWKSNNFFSTGFFNLQRHRHRIGLTTIYTWQLGLCLKMGMKSSLNILSGLGVRIFFFNKGLTNSCSWQMWQQRDKSQMGGQTFLQSNFPPCPCLTDHCLAGAETRNQVCWAHELIIVNFGSWIVNRRLWIVDLGLRIVNWGSWIVKPSRFHLRTVEHMD